MILAATFWWKAEVKGWPVVPGVPSPSSSAAAMILALAAAAIAWMHCPAGSRAAAAPDLPEVEFESVSVVGHSNVSANRQGNGCGLWPPATVPVGGGTKCSNHFWFPGSSFRTGVAGDILQAIGRAGDGAPCGQWAGNVKGPPAAACSQAFSSRDGGRTYSLALTSSIGWSGGFPALPELLGELLHWLTFSSAGPHQMARGRGAARLR